MKIVKVKKVIKLDPSGNVIGIVGCVNSLTKIRDVVFLSFPCHLQGPLKVMNIFWGEGGQETYYAFPGEIHTFYCLPCEEFYKIPLGKRPRKRFSRASMVLRKYYIREQQTHTEVFDRVFKEMKLEVERELRRGDETPEKLINKGKQILNKYINELQRELKNLKASSITIENYKKALYDYVIGKLQHRGRTRKVII